MGKEVITVERIGPYGVMANNQWYSIGKGAKFGVEDFVKGETYEVTVNLSQAGKKYMNSMTLVGGAIAGFIPPATTPQPDIHYDSKSHVLGKAFSNVTPSYEETKQTNITRNTAYQKATDAVSRLLMPFIANEGDIMPKLKSYVEDMANWLINRISDTSGPAKVS